MAQHNAAGALTRLLQQDWKYAHIKARQVNGLVVVQVRCLSWEWEGALTQKEWHRVVTAGINELGALPSLEWEEPYKPAVAP